MSIGTNTRFRFPKRKCIHELFSLQANTSLLSNALVFENQSMSYLDLETSSNQLAHYLIAQDAGTEKIIAICMDRSFEMFIGLLAILKSGAAYLPIDPNYPEERKLFMLEDSKASIILTRETIAKKIPSIEGTQIIKVDTEAALFKNHSVELPTTNCQPDNLIYTIYTSGSTGQPKGVQIEHQNVVNLIEAQINFVDQPVDRFLYAYSFAFDGAVLLIYWTLLNGGTLYIAPEGLEKDIASFGDYISKNKISHLLTFPSVYNLALDQLPTAQLNNLVSVSVAGEACPGVLVQKHHQLLKHTNLLNQYGPTEATVGCTIYQTPKDFVGEKTPIGKPIQNVFIEILNDKLERVATGEIGEIFIGGNGVARGYLNRPQLTAKQFIVNPYGNDPNDRLYKSGDLGRFLEDGNIDFVGRADHQVKLRGYRIELEEIESVLNNHPEIRETVVEIKGNTTENKKLVAYVVLKENGETNVSQLKAYLDQRMPDYMVPAQFVFLEKMPFANSGKIDRKALPEPSMARPELEQVYVAPSTDLQKFLCNLWQEVLQIEKVGVKDRFFELGGNSLQAAKFIAKVQKKIGETIFVVTLFDSPTIEEYSKLLERDYPEAVKAAFHSATIEGNARVEDAELTEKDFNEFSKLVPQINLVPESKNKNKKAIFILAPPRSGTTLLRVMLAGHPDIFAANELQLLHFNDMEERKNAYQGKFSLWSEGLVRAIMELQNCDGDQAKEIISDFEKKKYTTKQVYEQLQSWIGDSILVDKSPSYALDLDALKKAKAEFEDAFFIQLVRHPLSMIDSFAKMHMDQVMFLEKHNYSPKQLGELIWAKSHNNIVDFFNTIPENRTLRIEYETLVKNPTKTLSNLCLKLGIDFNSNLANPYSDLSQKMTDGIYAGSKAMGDPNFIKHGSINSSLADKWKHIKNIEISKGTWALAASFGYKEISQTSGLNIPESEQFKHFKNVERSRQDPLKSEQKGIEEIAIIGMSGRFPGAKNINEFWNNLVEEKDVSVEFSSEDLIQNGLDPNLINDPDYVPRGMPLEHADCFDASFFGYLPNEAALMDPQHRIYLECAYAALEDAGYTSDHYDGTIGVFGGVARNTYLVNNVLTHPNFFKSLDDFQQGIALEKDFPATRVAYKMNLKGAAVNVQTACSSSGVAIHLACQSLRAGDNDMVMVGGGRIQPPIEAGHLHKEGHALSPDGYCKAFDANAQGMVRGNGMAFLVLKKLSDAIKDGDTVHAVIKGTAINNDGSEKIGFTAPSIQGQSNAIKKAYQKANINPATISYIEAHGTGTLIGDPIEVAGLTKAFSEFTDKKGFCGIGSVKTNIGHLDAGACIAGVIKTVLALKHGLLPANLHFENPNPQIQFEQTPFFVNDKLRPWSSENGLPKRAGVSSFGLGGTNAHIVLEEAPEVSKKTISKTHQLLMWSAKTDIAKEQIALDLADEFNSKPDLNPTDVSYTLIHGRKHFKKRAFVVNDELSNSILDLKNNNPAKVFSSEITGINYDLVFMFPGGGAQHSNMGLGLYRQEPVFKNAVDECLALLLNKHDLDVRSTLYPENDAVSEPILDPLPAITLLFTIEYATAKLLLHWGLKPSLMIGHSLGEYTAACIAGLMSLEDALALVAKRGQLFQQLPEGAMLSVPMPENEVKEFLTDKLSFAAINKPDHCVVSGAVEEIDALKLKLNEKEIHSTRLHITVAAHSQEVEPILEEFRSFLKTIDFGKLEIPIVSNLTGDFAEEHTISNVQYWVDHLRGTVRFSDGANTILKLENKILIEVGPGQTLSTFARQHPSKQKGQKILATLRHPKETIPDLAFILKTLGQLWLNGIQINWSNYTQNFNATRTSLPTYPFERKRFWIEPKVQTAPLHVENTTTEITSLDNYDMERENSINQIVLTRKDLVVSKLKDLFNQLSGIPVDEMDVFTSFLELGFDSLFLTQATTKIKKQFKVKINFRQLFEEAPNIDALAELVDGLMPEDKFEEELSELNKASKPQQVATQIHFKNDGNNGINPVHPTVDKQQTVTGNTSVGDVQGLIDRQLQIMEQQLALLRGQNVVPSKPSQNRIVSKTPVAKPIAIQKLGNNIVSKNIPIETNKEEVKKGFGPWKPLIKKDEALDERQLKYLKELIERYTDKTKGSQKLTGSQRKHLADPRSITGFNKLWKDLIYQIAIEKSKGAKMWDVDGNEYVDFRMAFGISLFGHTPDFVQKAVSEQLEKGLELGVLTPLAKKVADLLCELTGMERATLVNTGSEALSAAVRSARTVTSKDKIAVFEGDYHGIADEFLVRSIIRDGKSISMPVAPGIPQFLVENVIVLDYEDPNVLDKIRAHADDLAAIIIEPIQPNFPIRQPVKLLKEIRKLTTEEDIALVFDEMITGFRLGTRGAQGWYGVEADIVAYGKIISGGLPMAAVAGKSRFMDAFDGGMWNFGDASIPEAGVTFFGGTFVKHPLSLAASLAALSEIKERGDEMYEALNTKTMVFAERLKNLFLETKVPLYIQCTSSILAVKLADHNPFSRLFFYFLKLKGVHWQEKAGLMSTAHTQEDLDFTYQVFEESIREMQSAGFFKITVFEQEDLNVIVPPPQHIPLLEKTSDGGQKKTIPLTEGQKEVWVEQQLGNEAAAAYNLSGELKFNGNLNVAVLEESLKVLMNRHESLRTIFDSKEPRQHVFSQYDLPYKYLDVSDKVEKEKQTFFNSLKEEETTQPLDIFKAPGIRFTLVKFSSEEYKLILTAHHAFADGWSCGIITNDLGAIYTSLSNNEKVELAEAKQLSEFVFEQIENQKEEEGQEAEEFWLNQFKDDVPVLEFPTDKNRPKKKTYDADLERILIEPELYEDLKRLSADQGTTFFITLYSAFQVFMHRLSGQEDFVLGMVAAAQAIAGNQNLVAHGVSLLPIRTKIDKTKTFSEQLKESRNSVLDAFEYQNYTLGSLVKKMKLARDESRQPIISFLFNMDADAEPIQFGNMQVSVAPIQRKFETFDTFINVKSGKNGIDFEWIYNTDLFEKATIRRRLSEFKTLLQELVIEPNLKIWQYNVLPDSELNQLLSWNNTETSFPNEVTIPALFEKQAGLEPDRIAVDFKGEFLNYETLNKRSNQLANFLIEKGLNKGDHVGIFMDRSIEMLIGLLACLKAGGVYVPLDPVNPDQRILTLLKDVEARYLISHEFMIDRLPDYDAFNVIIPTNKNWQQVHQNGQHLNKTSQLYLSFLPKNYSIENPVAYLKPEDLAYVIFTSGSTGKPKSIAIPHYAVIDHHFAMKEAIGFGKDDVIFSVASIAFDPSVQDFFLPLFLGAKVVIASKEATTDGFLLKKRMEESLPTIMQATPATWRILFASGWEGSDRLTILSGGEGLTKAFAEKLIERSKALYNIYGPTETTIWSTTQKVDQKLVEAKNEEGYMPIGKPINNVQLYILDEHLQRVPIGVPGEICIGGVGVAPSGYVKQERLTAEKFVANPFNSLEKIYRTGDVGRFLEDGSVEYLRRVDNQVKVRGFRIELGEIESNINRFTDIRENVVLVKEDSSKSKRIAAYVVMKNGIKLNQKLLKKQLRKVLPSYMVPSAFVEMQSFPMTASMKINRKKLPEPNWESNDNFNGYQAASTTNEKMLVKIWSTILKINKIGIHDNFFELGGHSLIAVEMMAKLEQQTGKKLPLASLLENPTVYQLATQMEGSDTDSVCKKGGSLVAIKTSGYKVPIYLVHGAGLHVLMFQTLANHMDEAQPIYALQARGLNGGDKPLDRIEDIAAHYLAEIIEQNPTGPYALAGYSFGGLIAFEMAKQLRAQGKEVLMLGMFDTVVRPTITGEKQSYYRHLANFSKKVVWNISSIVKSPMSNIKYKSNSISRMFKRWKWSISNNEDKAIEQGTKDHEALVDRMNQLAFENYKITPYEGEIHLFRAKERKFWIHDFEFLGWKPFAKEGVLIHDVPGDHLHLFNAPHGEEFAKILQTCLNEKCKVYNELNSSKVSS